jgi:hypothetical protein
MRSSAQDHRVEIELYKLRQPQTRLHGEEQQRVITSSDPRFCIGRCKDYLDLRADQEMNDPLIVALAGYQ